MRANILKLIKHATATALSAFLLTSGASFAVNLTAGPATATLPDGSTIPMWGYSCGSVVSGDTATCAALNSHAGTGWSPVVITIPTGQNLTINLTNNLSFGANNIPTSLVIVGQLGGGLGTSATSSPSPDHSSAQANVTWPIAGTAGNHGTPPMQGGRVQSFSTEVLAASTLPGTCPSANCASLTWTAPRPGTYLIESGTHPSIQGPMGLYGILVVTCAPGATNCVSPAVPGTAYPGVTYSADVPLLLSEIDPVQNQAVNTAVNTAGFKESATIGPNNNSPVSAVNVTGGGANYTSAPSVTFIGGGGGSGATATAIIDTGTPCTGTNSATCSPTAGQVTGITLTSGGAGYTATPAVTLSGGGGTGATATALLGQGLNAIAHCSGGAGACYPPAVNYTPLYYMINGVAFDKTNAPLSLFKTSPATGVAANGSVLVRLVNAGLRMHVPSIVGDLTGTPAVSGFGLIAEDGNPLPGLTRVQSEVFMAAGKTYDVMINVPTCTPVSPATTCTPSALPVYDRELSLSGNAINRDAGMLAYIGINSGGIPAAGAIAGAVARADTYNSVIAGHTITVSDPAKGVIANDTNVYGVHVLTPPTKGTLTLNANGTFTYTASATSTSDSFTYCANGTVTGTTCSSGVTATVTLGAASIEGAGGITLGNDAYTSNVATSLSIKSPGVLENDSDAAGYPLTINGASLAAPLSVALSAATGTTGTGTVVIDPNGGFNATVSAAGTYTFTYQAQNSQGTVSTSTATVTLIFPTPSNLQVSVVDGMTQALVTGGYRWIIEEDRTFYIDPACTTNPPAAGCPTFGPVNQATGAAQVPTFGTNFHTSYMPVVATGCTGPTGNAVACEAGQTLLGTPAVCDVGNGVCRTTATQQTPVDPSQVHLDPTKRYYISVLPGDAAIPFQTANASPGHGMGGAPIPAACKPVPPATTCTGSFAPVTVIAQPTPFPPAKLSVFVFEDDFPLNGEQDGGGGVDVLSPQEPGLGGFNITIMDDAGGPGDPTGQVDYDMFNQPLSNSLAGTIDPATGKDACPLSKISRIGKNDPTQTGITGTIVTCPKYEDDGTTLSPLAGQAVIANMMPGRYGVIATPAAERIAKGEEWLQTNTLDGQKAHDSFLRIGEPNFFQEYGPASFHVSIGFANPAIINARKAGVCNGSDPQLSVKNCTNTVTGTVTTERMSRTPDERLYSSGSNKSFAFTQCYVSFGDPDGEDFAFTKCDGNGNFTLSGLPDGDWRVTVFDQWNDMLVDGLSTPVRLSGGTTDLGQLAINQWQANFNTRTFLDLNGDGVSNLDASGNPEPGLALVKTNVRFRDGSFSNRNNTDLNGYAAFNEEFPLFSWYVIETDVTRFKNTGTHVVYDAGGPADGTPCGSSFGTIPCGKSLIAANLANTVEQVSLPTNLRVPGAIYCAGADCAGKSMASGSPSDLPSACTTSPTTGVTTCSTILSTGRIDPPWVLTEGWQGFSGQNNFLEFGKKPYATGENGGIRGHVVYSSTRPFDDPQFGTQNVWEPLVPNVTINLYLQSTAPDGSTSLQLVDTTTTSSFDKWAQGFRSDGIPNMNCPGQLPASTTSASGDQFFFSIYNQPNYLDWYNAQHGGPAYTQLPYNSQFKCYDGMHNWNQLQPAPYDGMYQFPSVTSLNPTTGLPAGTNCHRATTAEPWGCVPNPTSSTVASTDPNYDPYRAGTPMLAPGKYVVEVVVPPGYELVKEEDKNILIGDNFIAPVTVEFPGLGSAIYIMPDQAMVNSYNANNAQNPTQSLGRVQNLTSHEGDTPTMDTFWPCVGASRVVPDYISLFPQSREVAPFAGATRNLCDRKLVTLDDQTSSQAEFFIFTSTHAAAHFTGVITDDFTSEFDPFSPQFGEKFAPPDLPVAIKDWKGNEVNRVYADHWGAYNGLNYSTWEVNPPNPTGYSPTMMVTCMNDPGMGPTPDPLYNPAYSNFCYELPYMPGATQYMDTPVTPTSAFAGAGYNNPDCAYPGATPAISEVDGDGIGPWVSAAGPRTLTIHALGDQFVNNNSYSGPSATTAPYNQKTVIRHYGFGPKPNEGSGGRVTIGGIRVDSDNISTWNDTTIVLTVPNNVPLCAVQQQVQYGGPAGTTTSPLARCGELVITAANGKQSIDTVTVTIGGKAPTHVAASGTIQSVIDAANPGDLIMIDPQTQATAAGPGVPAIHNEMLLMWKPLRLQGVGSVSSVLNGDAHPAGKLDPWRREVNCLFGLAINGQPNSDLGNNPALLGKNPFDSSGTYSCPSAGNGTSVVANFSGTPTTLNYFTGTSTNPQVDRIPLEAVVGWDASQNGNLAEMLQEPSLMGALEGATITVLSKGVNFPAGQDPFGTGGAAAGVFPAGTTLLQNGSGSSDHCSDNPNPFPSNFECNPSSIDGLTVTNSSQGGGGIFVHAWGHNIQIANNRVRNNSGTLSGGINIGQGEYPPAYTAGGGAANGAPGSCQPETGLPTGTQLQYCLDVNVNLHHNAITLNSSTGDELFSATPAGAGGVSICNGSDYYKFNYNWVCGNLSTGDGGGMGHIGFSAYGDIEHNTVLFNQSTNPTIATNGGGILIMGAPDVDPTCGITTDQDCVSVPPVGPADGVGPGLVINANLIMGNAAESGSGGGLRFQHVNGTDVLTFPTSPDNWYGVTVTNNIIANNVAGWDGAGISLLDALKVNIINNTIVSNDSTATSGVLFNTLGAPLASSAGPTCTSNCGTQSLPQPSGLVAIQNGANLSANLPATILCPAGHGDTSNGPCRQYSVPELYNNVFWQNRTFDIGVGGLGIGAINQQNVVALYNAFTSTQAPSQPSADATTANGNGLIITGGTGACTAASYWDIGVRGDTGPANHAGGLLAPMYSVLTDAADYPGLNNSGSDPTLLSQYCNGSRVPPEIVASGGGLGWQVPPGISDATVPNPIFNLTPAATVDEGNNWINISWGPLALVNESNGAMNGVTLGNYAQAAGSPVINYIPSIALTYAAAPSLDFFGNPRKTNHAVDAGAVEFVGGGATVRSATLSPPSHNFGTVTRGSVSQAQVFALTNTGTVTLMNIAQAVLQGTNRTEFTVVRALSTCGPAGGGQLLGTTTLAPGASCVVTVQFSPLAPQGTGAKSATLSVSDAAGTQRSSLAGTAN